MVMDSDLNYKLHTAGTRHKRELKMNVWEAAQLRMDYIYENFDDVVISWSGGKDSSAILELARMSARKFNKLPIDIFFLDEEVIYPETVALCDRHRADPEIRFWWICVPSIYRNACSEQEPDFIPFEPGKEAIWTRQPPADAIWPAGKGMTTWRVPPSIPKRALIEMWQDKVKAGRKVIMLTGLRARESFVRYAGIMSSGSFISKPDYGIWHGRPIYDWTAKDVWWAIASQGWDYNKAYDKLWRAGGSVETTRIAPLFHAEAAMMLRRVMLYWPDYWVKVRGRLRGVHAMAIYGGKLHTPRCYPGETWEEAAERYWNGLGSAESKKVLQEAIAAKLKKHADHSTAPMSQDIKCLKCGLSWKIIAKACCLDDRQLRILEPYNT